MQITGLHIHIGSQIISSAPFISAMKRVIEFLDKLKKDSIPMEYLDIGGGLGIIYKDEKPQTAQDFAFAILPYLNKTDLKIVMEPGRFIVGNAGIFVTKVLFIKDNGFKKFVIVDGGMNPKTVKDAAKAGADFVVSGSFITKAENPKERIRERVGLS